MHMEISCSNFCFKSFKTLKTEMASMRLVYVYMGITIKKETKLTAILYMIVFKFQSQLENIIDGLLSL